ncbi:MAG: PIN domain-containing protein, partial [Bacteroidota bacterium]
MDRILVDTNIVIDLLGQRQDYYLDAQKLFTLADRGKIELFLSSLSIANAYYILAHRMKIQNVRSIIRRFKVLVTILPLN